MEEICVSSRFKFTFNSCSSNLISFLKKLTHHLHSAIQITFNFIEITFVFISDLFRNNTFGNLINIISSNINRFNKRLNKIIYTTDKFTPAAFEFISITTSLKSSFFSSINKFISFIKKTIHNINTCIQIILDFIEITIVIICYFFRDITLTDTINILSSNIQRTNNSIKTLIHTSNNTSPFTTKLLSITTSFKFTLNRSISQHTCFIHKTIHSTNTLVKIIFYLIEITVIVIRDLFRYVTSTNTINVFSCNI